MTLTPFLRALGLYDLADEITFATWLGTTLAGP